LYFAKDKYCDTAVTKKDNFVSNATAKSGGYNHKSAAATASMRVQGFKGFLGHIGLRIRGRGRRR
jgi:hypothetical protein